MEYTCSAERTRQPKVVTEAFTRACPRTSIACRALRASSSIPPITHRCSSTRPSPCTSFAKSTGATLFVF